jgi:hypothetical protein
MATSTRGLLLATSRPLRDDAPREIALVDACSKLAPSRSSTTHRSDAGCLGDGAPPSSRGSTLPPRRTTRRTHAPPRNPRTDQIARPTHRRSSRSGWTRGAFETTLPLGDRVLRCVRHEGSGDQTRAFTFSDAAIYITSTVRSQIGWAAPRTPRHMPTGPRVPVRSTSSAPPTTMTKELDQLRATSSDSCGEDRSSTPVCG